MSLVAIAAAAITCVCAQSEGADEMASALAERIANGSTVDAGTLQASPELVQAVLKQGDSRRKNAVTSAAGLYELARALAERSSDTKAEADADYRLADVLSNGEQRSRAETLAAESMRLYSAAGDPEHASNAAILLSRILTARGQLRPSLEVAKEAVSLALQTSSKLALGRAYAAAVMPATRLGDFGTALDCAQKGLAIAEELKNLQGQGAILNNLFVLYESMEDNDRAADYLERSIRIKRQQGADAHMASAYLNLGYLSVERNRLDEAQHALRQAIEEVRLPQEEWIRAGALTNLGMVASARKDYPQAEELFDKALQLAEQMGSTYVECETHFQKGVMYRERRQYTQAIEEFQKAETISRDAGFQEVLLRATYELGNAYRKNGELAEARTAYIREIDNIEQSRLRAGGDEQALATFDRRRDPYSTMVEFEASSGRPESAFHYSEMAKSRVLLDVIAAGPARMTRILSSAEQKRYRELLDRMANASAALSGASTDAKRKAAKTDLDHARNDYGFFRSAIYAAHPELASRRADPKPVSVAEAASLLPDDKTALLSYSAGRAGLFLFVITRRGAAAALHVHRLDEASVLKDAAAWVRSAGTRDLGFTAVAERLHTELIGPAAPELAGKVRWIVCPDGPLWQVPFDALQDSTGRFLIEDHEISYAPSVTVLSRMRASHAGRPHTQGDLLALADPNGDLPGSSQEASDIAQVYGASHSRVYTGPAARKDRLNQADARYGILHLATHGVFDNANPLYSYVQLAGSRLEGREIIDLDLPARLVVLSACESGRSNGSGDGLTGMVWAFFVAGTPATVASLWKVDSGSTRELMTGFHRNLHAGKPLAVALREAKLSLLANAKYRHPFYWAAFVSVGNGE